MNGHSLVSTYVVDTSGAVCCCWLPIAHKTVGPDPFDMLDRTASLCAHNVAEAGVVCRGSAIGDGKVLASGVTVQEDGDVEDLARVVVRVRR
jgi:hypothetical protein